MESLGKYRLIRKLATGGMAEVFLAKAAGPMGFEKTLVVKRILPHLAEDPAFVEMFLSEAKLAARLNHANLVQIFDFGMEEGAYFIAMEYIEGLDLRTISRRAFQRASPISYPVVARILALSCEGLAYAHELVDPDSGQPLGLIHRDISPDNILVSQTGGVKVLDFGIAKAANASHRTQSGVLKGKVAYMAPEYLLAQPIDARADVYALGVVLFELVAGRKPYMADSDVLLIQAILRESVPDVRTLRADVPEALSRIIDRALAKNFEERYASCREMQADLERFLFWYGDPVGALQIVELIRDMQAAAPALTPLKTPAVAPPPAPSPASAITVQDKNLTQSVQAPVTLVARRPSSPKESPAAVNELAAPVPTQEVTAPVPVKELTAPVQMKELTALVPVKELTPPKKEDVPQQPAPPAAPPPTMRVPAPPTPRVAGKALNAARPQKTGREASRVQGASPLRWSIPIAGIALVVAAGVVLRKPGSASKETAPPPPPPAAVQVQQAPAVSPQPQLTVEAAQPVAEKAAPEAATPASQPEAPVPEAVAPTPVPPPPSRATLRLVSNLPGQVRLNGTPLGQPPLTQEVEPGPVRIDISGTVRGQRFDKSHFIELQAGENREVALSIQKVSVTLRGRPDDLKAVSVDGQPLDGEQKVTTYEGRHVLKLVHPPTGKSYTSECQVKVGDKFCKFFVNML